MFTALSILYFIIGVYASRSITTNTDYFLAGKKLNIFSVTFTLIATQLGGNLLLGIAQKSYVIGLYGIVYALGMSLGFLLLASGFAARLQQADVPTTAALFEKYYHSPLLKKIASFISILSLCGILVSIIVSSKTLLYGLGIDNELIFLLFWLFIIGYTMVGGLHAVVLTDIFQVIFIIISIGSIFLYSLYALPAPLIPLSDLLHSSFAPISFSKVLPTFLMPALFSLIEQDLAQRFFAARSQKVALFSALFSGIFITVFGLIPVYFGMQAQLTGIALPANGNPFIAILETVTSEPIFLLALCGIMAAITSTADSLLCAISSNIAQDFDLSFTGIKNTLALSQGVTFLAGIASIIASYTVNENIIDIAIGSYELSVCCLFVPSILCLFTKNVYKNGAFGAALFGFTSFCIFRIYPITYSKEVITLLLSLCGYGIGSLKK